MINPRRFWAKQKRAKSSSLSYGHLPGHTCAVAAIAGIIADSWPELVIFLSKRWRVSPDETKSILQFLAFIHDVGKATYGFQFMRGDRAIAEFLLRGIVGEVNEDGLDVIHNVSGAAFIEHNLLGILEADFGEVRSHGNDRLWPSLVVLMHHGFLGAPSNEHSGLRDFDVVHGGGKFIARVGPDAVFMEAMRAIVSYGARRFLKTKASRDVVCTIQRKGAPKDDRASLMVVVLCMGLVSTSDWIASDERNVEFYDAAEADLKDMTVKEYDEFWDRELAHWTGKMSPKMPEMLRRNRPASPVGFEDLFGFKPNALQELVIRMVGEAQGKQFILFLEEAMGSGKTEAGLYAAMSAMLGSGLGGMFYGLPTCATANSKIKDVVSFVRRVSSPGQGDVSLVHGMSSANEEYKGLRKANPEAYDFFRGNKKGILGRYSLGTIDQGLLGMLMASRFFFVRSMSMVSRVVVIDEVHCYDAYTSRILEEWLGLLSELGCTVIMLSATLTRSKLKRMAEKYSKGASDLVVAKYPRVTMVSRDGSIAKSETIDNSNPDKVTSPRMRVRLEFLTEEEALEKARSMSKGAIGWISNKVDSCLDRTLKLKLMGKNPRIIHARMRQLERLEKEGSPDGGGLLGLLGKKGLPGRKAGGFHEMVMSTQVMEQSMNIDFDALFSDICPIDILFQRIGRLMRFLRIHGLAERPFKVPTVYVILRKEQMTEKFDPSLFKSDKVYDEDVLACSYFALTGGVKRVVEVDIPGDIEDLIEKTYSWVADFGTGRKSLSERLEEKATNHEIKALHNCADMLGPAWGITKKLPSIGTIPASDALSDDDGDAPMEDDEAPSSATRLDEFRKRRVVCLTSGEMAAKGISGRAGLREVEETDPNWLLERSTSLPEYWFLGLDPDKPWDRMLKYYCFLEFKEDGDHFSCPMKNGRVCWSVELGFWHVPNPSMRAV